VLYCVALEVEQRLALVQHHLWRLLAGAPAKVGFGDILRRHHEVAAVRVDD
jgi:hypothetical protein